MSVLSTFNSASTAVTAGSTLPLGSAVHGCGKGISLNNNSIVISGNGYYSIDASVTVLPTADTTETLTLYENGVAVAAVSSAPADAGSAVELSLPWLCRKTGCACNLKTYTFTLSGAGVTTSVITRTMSA